MAHRTVYNWPGLGLETGLKEAGSASLLTSLGKDMGTTPSRHMMSADESIVIYTYYPWTLSLSRNPLRTLQSPL